MAAKTWNEMSDAERAEILRQEDEREARKSSFAGADEEPVSDSDWAEYLARCEERMGDHKDHWYW